MKPKNVSIRSVGPLALALALTATLGSPAGAMTLIRAGLDDLVAANSTIVIAKVEGATSYWNADANLILTDYRLTTTQVLKGRVEREITLTQMGGTAGELTTLIPGGANLLSDQRYVLFLRHEPLPGTEPVLTVAEHCQGAFDIESRDSGDWAISQAADESLVDDKGDPQGAEVPGGAQGLSLDELVKSITALVDKGGAR